MAKKILLTRSSAQNESVAKVLDKLGYGSVSLPLIDIVNTSDISALKMIREEAGQFDMFIFVSTNAVKSGIQVLVDQKEGFKSTAMFLAVGDKTAAEISHYFPSVMFPQEGVGGEALMDSAEMHDLSGKRVLIIRGEHGKAWMGNEIERRGAKVDYFDCYRRRQPRFLETTINKYFSEEMFDVCLLHSAHAVTNLIEASGSIRSDVLNASAIAGSEDIRKLMVDFGWKGTIIVAKTPANQDMLTALAAII